MRVFPGVFRLGFGGFRTPFFDLASRKVFGTCGFFPFRVLLFELLRG